MSSPGMVDRQKTLVEFVTAWAEYRVKLGGISLEMSKLPASSPELKQMISRITDDISSSPEDQRQLAMQLAMAEVSRPA